MSVQQIHGFGRSDTPRDRALEKIDEEEATLLEVGKDFFAGLPCRGDEESREKITGKAGEQSLGRVEKLGISLGGRSGEQQSLDMNGAKTRGPFEALQAACNVLGRDELAAAIARQKCGNGHIQKW